MCEEADNMIPECIIESLFFFDLGYECATAFHLFFYFFFTFFTACYIMRVLRLLMQDWLFYAGFFDGTISFVREHFLLARFTRMGDWDMGLYGNTI